MSARTIGTYELEGLLGEGGIGQVYAARDTVLGRQVAIKTLRPELSRDRSFVERFYAEAKSLGTLNHPNITTVYALHAEGDEAFMAMELVRGYTLEALLGRVDHLTLRDSLAVLAQAIAGIGYAHRMGIIHRDLKPANLMLTGDGVLKIMDFGIARVRGSQHLTRVGEFCGTFVYASPEQIKGDEVDERSDLYSLAIVFYRLLTGAPPFASTNEYALMTAQLQTPPPPLTGRVPGLDDGTEQALMRALAKRPEDRYASVEEFGRAIGAAALRGESVDILQQLYARAFSDEDPDATRIVTARPSALADPTMPSNRGPRPTGDWQLPPSLPGTPFDTPQSRSAASRHEPVVAVPQTSAAPPAARRASGRWLGGAAALALPLMLAGGYFLVTNGMLSLPFPGQPQQTEAAAPAPAPAEITRHEPQPPSAPASSDVAKSEPSPPLSDVAKGEPPPSPPAPTAVVNSEPPPAPASPPAAQTADTGAPASSSKPASPEVAKSEPAPAEPVAPTGPANIANNEPPPAAPAPAAPSEAAKNEAPPAPPTPAPASSTVSNEPAPPPAQPASVEVAKSEPPASPPTPLPTPLPTPAGNTVSNETAPPAPASTVVAKNEPQAPPEQQASLGPKVPPEPPKPEGEPDLQGRVTGAKRLDEIEVAAHWIKIYGIVDNARGAQEAEHIQALVRYLKPSRNHLVCYRKAVGAYRCYSDGQDIARLALLDGIVRLAPNAPPEYRSLLAQRR